MADVNIELKGFNELSKKLSSIGEKVRSVDAIVGTNTSYAPWVGSQRFQARVHRGRWETDEGVLEHELSNIVEDFQVAIDAAIDAVHINENPIKVGAKAATLRVMSRMTNYPAPPIGSHYRRTLTYGRRWTTKVDEKQ